MKNKKSFIAGMVTMLLLVSLVGTAYATVGTVTRELEYKKYQRNSGRGRNWI